MRPSLFCGCFGEVLSQVFLQHLQLRDILHHGIHELLEVFFVLPEDGESQLLNLYDPEKKLYPENNAASNSISCLGRCLITRSTRRSTRPVTCPIGVGLDLIEKPWLQLHRFVRLAICYGSSELVDVGGS